MTIKWIECGLPWNMYSFDSGPEYPTKIIGKRAKKEFGLRYDKMREKLFPNEIMDEAHEIAEKLRNKIDKMDLTEEEKENRYWEKLDKSTNPVVKSMLEWYDFMDKYAEWEEKQPEIIEYCEKEQEHRKQVALKSFCGRKLNQPGTLIELEDGKQFLIGDINSSCGVCDDCVEFENDTIIKRYAVVWKKK